uniref:CAP_N domain-containing protein n=1 Tax=Macrostomum lignano TaxID=282301 RepID=A0A1I8F693_9PLAT
MSDLKQLNSLVSNLESALGVSGGSGGGGGASVAAFDSSVGARLTEFDNASRQVGGDVAELSPIVLDAFAALRSVLVEASNRPSRPNDAELQRLLEPLSRRLQKVEFRNSKRASAQFNHLSAVAESIGALGWVAQPEKPAPFPTDAGVFYSNRVLKEAKDGKAGGEAGAAWAKAWTAVINSMIAYVKENHLTGLVWGGSGGSSGGTAAASAEATMESVLHRLEALTAKVKSGGAGVKAGSGDDASSNGFWLRCFDRMSAFTAATAALDSADTADVRKIVDMANMAFQLLRNLLGQPRPASGGVQSLPTFQQLSQSINQAVEFREANRTSRYFNHLSAVSASLPAFGWVQPRPVSCRHARDLRESGQFYTDKILTEYKRSDTRHVTWAAAWIDLLKEIRPRKTPPYSCSVLPVLAPRLRPACPRRRRAPPPPPPPRPAAPPPPAGGADDGAAKAAALFAEIN